MRNAEWGGKNWALGTVVPGRATSLKSLGRVYRLQKNPQPNTGILVVWRGAKSDDR